MDIETTDPLPAAPADDQLTPEPVLDPAMVEAAAWDEMREVATWIAPEDRPSYDVARGGFVIDTERKAVWAANKILGARDDEARAKAAATATTSDRKQRREALEKRFLGPLKDWTLANLPHKKRQIVTLAGLFKLRATSEAMAIDDSQAALDWATLVPEGGQVANLPEAGRMVWSVAPGFEADAIAVLKEHASHLLVGTPGLVENAADRFLAHYKKTGELPAGCRYVEAGDAFSLAAAKQQEEA